MNNVSRFGAVASLALTFGAVEADAQLFGGPVPVYDAAHHATTILSHVEELAQTATQLSMLRDMLENSLRSGSPAWGELEGILSEMEAVLRRGQAITYALGNVSGRFRGSFAGFDPADNYAGLYQRWSRELLDTLEVTLEASGVNARDADSVDEALTTLGLRNRRALGRMQALQVGNALSSRQIEELAKLRQLLAASISAQNVSLATAESREAARMASLDRLLEERPTDLRVESRLSAPLLHLPFGQDPR